jgi:phosphatidylglycerophosphatase A
MKQPSILLKLIVSAGGSGFSPIVSGTVGSAVTCAAIMAFAYFVPLNLITIGAYLALGFFFSILGIFAADKYCRQTQKEDPSEIVIDEVAGQWLAAAAPLFLNWFYGANAAISAVQLLVIFLLFRFFDILKPWPISWCDEKIPGGFGVMIDDILAGIAAAVSYALLYSLLPIYRFYFLL